MVFVALGHSHLLVLDRDLLTMKQLYIADGDKSESSNTVLWSANYILTHDK